MNAASDERNAWGFPPSPVSAHVPENAGNFHQAVDNSVNKALPWVAFSWFLSGGAVVGMLMMALLAPRYVDSRVAEGVSDSKAATAQDLAKAQAEMHMASTNALLAKDRTDKVAAALEARGLIKLENH